jgi:hypothetical protein
MIAPGRAGELADSYHPHPWPGVAWLVCDVCGQGCAAPRSEQGHLGRWAVCSSATCRTLYVLSTTQQGDALGVQCGVLVAELHAHLIG